jgi:hypothetical protein
VEQLLNIADRTGALAHKVNCPTAMAVWMIDIGEVEEGERFCNLALAAGGLTDAHEWVARVFVNLGEIALWRGRYEDGVSHYRKVRNLPASAGDVVVKLMCESGIGLCALRLGDLAEARRMDNAALWDGDVYFDCTIPTWFKVEMARTRGELDKGLEFLDRVISRAAESGWRLTWMKLLLIQIDYLARIDAPRAATLAQEGAKWAADLKLTTRAGQFQSRVRSLLARAGTGRHPR